MASPTYSVTNGGKDTTAMEKQRDSNDWRAWLSVKQLSTRYGAHEATIWRWAREGRMRPVIPSSAEPRLP